MYQRLCSIMHMPISQLRVCTYVSVCVYVRACECVRVYVSIELVDVYHLEWGGGCEYV